MMRYALMAVLLLATARPLDSARSATQDSRTRPRQPNIIIVLIDDAGLDRGDDSPRGVCHRNIE